MDPNRFRGDPQIQLALAVIGQQPAGLLDEQTQLGVITRRPDMTDDPAAAIDGFGDLNRRRTRRIHTIQAAYRPKLVPSGGTKPKHHPRSGHRHPSELTKVTQLGSNHHIVWSVRTSFHIWR